MTTRVRAFLAVGAIGFAVQMGVLLWLSSLLALAVSSGHGVRRRGRRPAQLRVARAMDMARPPAGKAGLPDRLLRYHLGTGLTSLVGNLIVTSVAVELLHLPTLAANVCAVVGTSIANFLIADQWVFSPPIASGLVVMLLLVPNDGAAAELKPETVAAWNRHVAAVEMTLRDHETDPPVGAPAGRAIPVPGGTIHEWRGSVLVEGVTVSALVQALESPGLPPPADDILDARVMTHHGDGLHLYMKLARTAIITVTYDTEHDVTFVRTSSEFATSRSVSTSIREEGGSDRGFLWRLNSYWRYRQQGDDVLVDVLSVSLSRDVPALAQADSVAAHRSHRARVDATGRWMRSTASDAGSGCAGPRVRPMPR